MNGSLKFITGVFKFGVEKFVASQPWRHSSIFYKTEHLVDADPDTQFCLSQWIQLYSLPSALSSWFATKTLILLTSLPFLTLAVMSYTKHAPGQI